MAHAEEASSDPTFGDADRALFATGEPVDAELRESLRAEGAFWPGEFACPIFTTRADDEGRWLESPRFQGCTTMLGGDLFLSAGHVLRACGNESRPVVAALDLSHVMRYFFIRVEWVEYHPNPHCDLVIGKLGGWNARCMWAGWGAVSPPHEVYSVGYPLEVMSPFQQGDGGALDSARYMRGFVTRSLTTFNDPFAQVASFEVDFGLSPGMSGSPVWGYDADQRRRILVGVAIGSNTESTLVSSETEVRSSGEAVVRETRRLNEFGVALRLGAVLGWRIAALGNRRLGELIPNDGDGELPAYLRQGSDYWRPTPYEHPAGGFEYLTGGSGNDPVDRGSQDS